MLDGFKDYKNIHIPIWNSILDLTWPNWIKLTLEQQYVLSVLHSQYHACWCSGDFRSQCISRHSIDLKSWNIPSPAAEELCLSDFTRHQGQYKLWNHNIHIGIIIFPHIDNTQCTGRKLFKRKSMNKIKWEHPLSWLVNENSNLQKKILTLKQSHILQ